MHPSKLNLKFKDHYNSHAVIDNYRTNIEQIGIDIKNLDTQLQKIKKQIDLPNTDGDIKEQMMDFLQSAESEIAVLKCGMDAVESMRLKLADFFCEDPASFKLEECFKIFQIFCDKFKQAVKENERRQQMEEQANLRQKQREEQLARRAKYGWLSLIYIYFYHNLTKNFPFKPNKMVLPFPIVKINTPLIPPLIHGPAQLYRANVLVLSTMVIWKPIIVLYVWRL